MNKRIIWLSLIAVLALTLTATTVVSADTGDPTPATASAAVCWTTCSTGLVVVEIPATSV